MSDPHLLHFLQQIIEFLGTFAFAISGIRHAAAKNFDLFGGYVCGFAVAIGCSSQNVAYEQTAHTRNDGLVKFLLGNFVKAV